MRPEQEQHREETIGMAVERGLPEEVARRLCELNVTFYIDDDPSTPLDFTYEWVADEEAAAEADRLLDSAGWRPPK